jgi:hypothetical protein
LFEVIAFPPPSTATQRVTLGHERLDSPSAPATFVSVQAVGPPVGFVEVTTAEPLLSIATQSLSLGQDTSDRYGMPLKPSRLVTVHAAAPAVGLLEVITLAYSTATQRLLLGQ